jgi:hypothetical protein
MTDFRALCAELAACLQGRKDLECGWPGEDPEQELLDRARAVLAKPEPQGPSERFEFSVLNSEYEEQAGGTAPTYSQALSEGQHYLAMYSQDGPHSLEIRRVEVLPHYALPVPQQLEVE